MLETFDPLSIITKFFEKKNYQEVINLSKTHSLFDSTNERILGIIACSYEKLGDKISAVQSWKRMIEIYAKRNALTRVKAIYTKISRLIPTDTDILMSLAMLCYRIKNHQEAEKYIVQAMETFNKKDDIEWAIRILETGLGKDPSNQEFKNRLITLYKKIGEKKSMSDFYLNLADIHISEKNIESAKNVLQNLINLGGNDNRVIVKLMLLRAISDLPFNSSLYEMLPFVNLEDADSLLHFANEYYSRTNNSSQTKQLLKLANSMKPDDIKILEKMVMVDPFDLESRQALKFYYAESGETEKATENSCMIEEIFRKLENEIPADETTKKIEGRSSILTNEKKISDLNLAPSSTFIDEDNDDEITLDKDNLQKSIGSMNATAELSLKNDSNNFTSENKSPEHIINERTGNSSHEINYETTLQDIENSFQSLLNSKADQETVMDPMKAPYDNINSTLNILEEKDFQSFEFPEFTENLMDESIPRKKLCIEPIDFLYEPLSDDTKNETLEPVSLEAKAVEDKKTVTKSKQSSSKPPRDVVVNNDIKTSGSNEVLSQPAGEVLPPVFSNNALMTSNPTPQTTKEKTQEKDSNLITSVSNHMDILVQKPLPPVENISKDEKKEKKPDSPVRSTKIEVLNSNINNKAQEIERTSSDNSVINGFLTKFANGEVNLPKFIMKQNEEQTNPAPKPLLLINHQKEETLSAEKSNNKPEISVPEPKTPVKPKEIKVVEKQVKETKPVEMQKSLENSALPTNNNLPAIKAPVFEELNKKETARINVTQKPDEKIIKNTETETTSQSMKIQTKEKKKPSIQVSESAGKSEQKKPEKTDIILSDDSKNQMKISIQDSAQQNFKIVSTMESSPKISDEDSEINTDILPMFVSDSKLKKEDKDLMIQELKKLANNPKKVFQANLKIAEIYLQMEKSEEAIQYFTKAYYSQSKGFDCNLDLLIKIADLYYEKHDYQNAFRYFLHASTINPNQVEVKEKLKFMNSILCVRSMH